MIFVELTPFIAFRERHWTDEELAALQAFLAAAPTAGDLVPGGGGLRKVRWRVDRRGKRGGARVIYWWHARASAIYLIFAYTKARQDNLTKRQLRDLRSLLRGLTGG